MTQVEQLQAGWPGLDWQEHDTGLDVSEFSAPFPWGLTLMATPVEEGKWIIWIHGSQRGRLSHGSGLTATARRARGKFLEDVGVLLFDGQTDDS